MLNDDPSRDDFPTVLIDEGVVDEFVSAAVTTYQRITPQSPLPCFALLLGNLTSEAAHIRSLRFGRNVRSTDPSARREFTDAIVPNFGPAYENETRAWWFDPYELLRISRDADHARLEILGSIHMHPDWHRIGPPSERGLVLSECPTPMDQYIFRGTAWPINAICYLEHREGHFFHALAAWGPPEEGSTDEGCSELPLRVQTTWAKASQQNALV
ncbi:hypothetical protein ABZS96_39260 [Streptomyces avermitilis]|uniref:hypothetical protein n=1 Tax=Streptomyces avermitilis TaxID=33903 RepID=UPI0033A1A562